MARFQKGQSGNPGGRPKERPWRDALREEIEKAASEETNASKLQEMAKKVVAMALEGDIHAIREIGDRLEGKPSQEIINDADTTADQIKQILEMIDGRGHGLPSADTDTGTVDAGAGADNEAPGEQGVAAQ